MSGAGPRDAAFAIAYRMLGSVADAEDIAQETVVRLHRETAEIANPQAWATTVATRLAIDELRSARARRETYVGPWLPEPLLEDPAPGPDARAELADTLSQALLVALERLTPLERAAFLLREAFDYDHARIATIIDRSEAATRQLVHRARAHVAAEHPRFDPDSSERDRLFERFMAAVEEGDLEPLESLLAEDVVLWSDGGGKVAAARKPLHGPIAVARFLVRIGQLTARRDPDAHAERVRVNGQPGCILRAGDGSILSIMSADVSGGRIVGIRIVRNPDKLVHVE